MKKTILILCLLFCVHLASAQKKFETYYSSLSKEVYEIKINVTSPKKYDLYIDMYSFDKIFKSGGIILSENELNAFIDNLRNAQVKYNEWVKISLENELKEADRIMNFYSKSGTYFSADGWRFSFNQSLHFTYKILKEKHYLLVKTGKITDSANKYITHDGFIFSFQSSEEIDKFIELFSDDKIAKFVNKPTEKDLFKD